jgi:hypothetical protein
VRDYRIDRIGAPAFEGLVGHLCREVLGIAASTFADGPDGGRDARFEGTAQRYPSEADPWSGKFIIQAKHTSNRNASCGDGSFWGNRSSVVADEIPRIKKLKKKEEVDHYLMFTNRRLPAGRREVIVTAISDDTGVESLDLHGVEYITGLLERRPEIVTATGLDRLLGPIRFHAADLKDIVEAFHSALNGDGPAPDDAKQRSFPVSASLDEKNEQNDLSEVYYRTIQKRSAAYFGQLRDFLRDPINADLARRYEILTGELDFKVMSRRGDFVGFERVFEALYDQALELVPDLSDRGDLLWVFLHFMYWDCDLGES